MPHYATPLRCGQAPLGERLQEARRASEALAGELQRARGCAERERGRAEEASDATAAAAARADRAEGLAEAAERARREEREYLERRIRLLQEEAERLAEQRAESVARAALLEQRLSESEEAAVTGRGVHDRLVTRGRRSGCCHSQRPREPRDPGNWIFKIAVMLVVYYQNTSLPPTS